MTRRGGARKVMGDVRQVAGSVAGRAVGDGARRRVLDRAATVLRRDRADLTGYSTVEYRARRERRPGSEVPARRPGAGAVAMVNQLAAVLPIEATVLARVITDAAPAGGAPMHRTLRDVLERYLPESLEAFAASTPGPAAHDRLMLQLRLLHQVVVSVQQAQADHNARDLIVQERFLKDRFAELSPSALAPPPLPGAAAGHGGAPGHEAGHAPVLRAPARMPMRTAPVRTRVQVDVDHDSVVVLAGQPGQRRSLTLRLALPVGVACTLGVVSESMGGVTAFDHRRSRRVFARRRPTGFTSPQVDLTMGLEATALRRFLIYARGPGKGTPQPTVLFVREGDSVRGGDVAQVDLPTLITGDAAVALTVIASGYATPSGLVLRNESSVYPTLRAACDAFGYASVTWLDDDTPIV